MCRTGGRRSKAMSEYAASEDEHKLRTACRARLRPFYAARRVGLKAVYVACNVVTLYLVRARKNSTFPPASRCGGQQPGHPR